MRAHPLLRPLVVIAASLSVMGSALADTFGNFTYFSDGTSVTISAHANVATPSLVFPSQINGVPVRTIAYLGSGNLANSATSVTIPEGITTISASVFSNFSKLTSVTLPNSVTSLGSGVFQNCASLQSVTLPSGLTTIQNLAFGSCTALTTLNLPSALTTIESNAFYNCTSLTSVSLPPSLTTIEDGAFASSGLTSLTLPPALKTIGSGVFSGCTGLTRVTVPESVTAIGDNAFWNCPNLADVHLPKRFLSSLSAIGFDYVPEVASNLLVDGISNELANSPAFVSKLADSILAKSGHYGLATQTNISEVVAQTPQAVREVLAEINGGPPPSYGITSDLGTLTVKKGKPLAYAVATSFGATAFAAIGLPDGVVIDSATGAISGKPKKAGTFSVFLHAGIPGGGSVSGVKVISVTP